MPDFIWYILGGLGVIIGLFYLMVLVGLIYRVFKDD